MLKIANCVQIAPCRSGLYETAREVAWAQNKYLGWDSRLVDVTGIVTSGGKPLTEGEDRGVPIAPLDWAHKADVHVLHTGIPSAIEGTKPVFYFAHGIPEYIFYSQLLMDVDADPKVRTERANRGPFFGPWSLISSLGKKDWMKGAISLWRRHVPYLEPYFNKVILANHFCDLTKFKPEGEKVTFAKPATGGGLNIVFADHWRYNAFKDPFQILHGARKFCRETGSRIHMYAVPVERREDGEAHPVVQYSGHPWHSIIYGVSEDLQHVIGDLCTVHGHIDHVHRAADILITPSCDDTRTILEASACGCPVLAREGTDGALFHCRMEDPYELDRVLRDIHRGITQAGKREEYRKKSRELAERFSLEDAVRKMEKGMLEVL